MMKIRLFFLEKNYLNRFLLRIITHIPLLYPFYFFILQLLKHIFSQNRLINFLIDITLLLFCMIILLSHLIFLSTSPEFSLKRHFLQEEIQRNLGLLQDPANENFKEHPDKKLLEIEVLLTKFIWFLLRFLVIIGLELFFLYEFELFWDNWIIKEVVFLCFGLIYTSNLGYKIYEKMELKQGKWLFFGVFLIGYGMMKGFYQIYSDEIF